MTVSRSCFRSSILSRWTVSYLGANGQVTELDCLYQSYYRFVAESAQHGMERRSGKTGHEQRDG